MYIPLSPARVKTEASFTAEDPWNQNRRTAFTIEAYILVVRGTRPAPGAKPLAGNYLYGIRSELDGQEHMLPESLSELWRTNQVPPEALPRLLKAIAPKLKRWDYRPILHNKLMKVTEIIVTTLMGLLALSPIAIGILTGEMSALATLTVTSIFVAFVALSLYLIFYRKRARRTKQMKWALAQK